MGKQRITPTSRQTKQCPSNEETQREGRKTHHHRNRQIVDDKTELLALVVVLVDAAQFDGQENAPEHDNSLQDIQVIMQLAVCEVAGIWRKVLRT